MAESRSNPSSVWIDRGPFYIAEAPASPATADAAAAIYAYTLI